jgi:hypothetical protein
LKLSNNILGLNFTTKKEFDKCNEVNEMHRFKIDFLFLILSRLKLDIFKDFKAEHP